MNQPPNEFSVSAHVLRLALFLVSVVAPFTSLRAQTIAIDCSVSHGGYPYFSSRMNFPNYYGCSADPLARFRDDDDYLNLHGLANNAVRIFLSPETARLNGVGTYKDYVNDAAAHASALLVAISAPGATTSDPSTYEYWVAQILAYYKALQPSKFIYIEGFNEPDLYKVSGTTITPEQYYDDYFTRFITEIKIANDNRPAGSPEMQLGGPVTGRWHDDNPSLDTDWLGRFLTRYHADTTTANKRLDFISYHEYASFGSTAITRPDNLVTMKNRRSFIEGKLSAASLPTSLPCFITESGIYPGGNFDCGGYPITSGIVMQAASQATMAYYFVAYGSGKMIPYVWATRIDQHQEKSFFIPQSDQVLTPFGHTVSLYGRLDPTRVQATMSPDPTATTDGFGVYALPTIKTDQVAVLVWNWRHDSTTSSSTVTISWSNLPSGFAGHTVHMTRYLVDSSHSNYLASYASAGLYTAASISNFAISGYSLTLEPNAVNLIVLDPE